MGYGSISGRAKTDVNNPKAFAVCDRCARWYNHVDLRFQYDYRGRTLANLRILVCDDCYDDPQPQLKPRIIPPDPVSIENARVEYFANYETNNRSTSEPIFPSPTNYPANFWTGIPVAPQQYADNRITQTTDNRVTQTTGEAPYGNNTLPGTNVQVPGNNQLSATQGLPYGFDQIPDTGPLTPYTPDIRWTNGSGKQAFFGPNTQVSVSWVPTVPQPD